MVSIDHNKTFVGANSEKYSVWDEIPAVTVMLYQHTNAIKLCNIKDKIKFTDTYVI